MPAQIFISYSAADKNVADAVCAGLEQARLRCWIAPRDCLLVRLVAASVWRFVAAAPGAKPTHTAPATLPIRRYQELAGEWIVIERVRPDHGGWEIVWTYDATILGSRLIMRGKKKTVVEPSATEPRQLTSSEDQAVSVYTLDLTDVQAIGTGDERDGRGVIIRSTLRFRFDDNLMSFNGVLQVGGSDVATILGSKK